MFKQTRDRIWWAYKELAKHKRIFFPSPAEIEFVRIMGGKVIVFNRIRLTPRGAPLAFIVWKGRFLRREYMEREWRVGPYYLDFAFITPYDHKGIEIDGSEYHKDIVKEQRRDDYLKARGWRMLHIRARDVWQKPYETITRVRNFLER